MHTEEMLHNDPLWDICEMYELEPGVLKLQQYQVDGKCRVSIEPSLEALEKTTLTLEPGDIIEGYEVITKKRESWIYIPHWDRFIWCGRKVHHI